MLGGFRAASAWTIFRDPLEVIARDVIKNTGVVMTGFDAAKV